MQAQGTFKCTTDPLTVGLLALLPVTSNMDASLLHDELPARRLQSLDESELRRAVRHYRRAITALKSSAFRDLPEETSEHLLDQLSGTLGRVERELSEREKGDG